jgi:predicted dienelactone hydrolase
MHAMKNAGAKAGTFPIILYGPSPGGSAYDNVVLCEHIASYGYIFASVASRPSSVFLF